MKSNVFISAESQFISSASQCLQLNQALNTKQQIVNLISNLSVKEQFEFWQQMSYQMNKNADILQNYYQNLFKNSISAQKPIQPLTTPQNAVKISTPSTDELKPTLNSSNIDEFSFKYWDQEEPAQVESARQMFKKQLQEIPKQNKEEFMMKAQQILQNVKNSIISKSDCTSLTQKYSLAHRSLDEEPMSMQMSPRSVCSMNFDVVRQQKMTSTQRQLLIQNMKLVLQEMFGKSYYDTPEAEIINIIETNKRKQLWDRLGQMCNTSAREVIQWFTQLKCIE
ncbi:Hypothetical_protein [Hexamita inflata]|uniref:Hypothetical_protein n=2 Tax=Hexamita inflata TaxID=28002 RepID=A0AA86RPI1_9EUKA|nr:Hypothetical protein HINF_LOCUS65936 [Hexamita inflata]